MRFSIGKRGLLIFLVVMALLTLSPADEHASEGSAKDQTALNSSAASRVPQTEKQFGLNSMVHTRRDIHEIIKLFNGSGKLSEEALDDDITLIVADYQHV